MTSNEWSAVERGRLVAALQAAYYNVGELELLVFFALGMPLDALAGAGTLPARLTAVVQWAEAEGRLDDLLRAAYERKPKNPALRDLRARTPEASAEKRLVLFVSANPRDTQALRLDEECAAVEREIAMTPGRDTLVLRSKWAVTVDDLMRHLNELKPALLHFSGHGDGAVRARAGEGRDVGAEMEPRGGLAFTGEGGHTLLVSGEDLARMLHAAAPSVRVVVLNACYSEELATALCEVVDNVVGMRGAIGDAAAAAFAVGFYRALGNGSSVANAVDQGTATLAAKGFRDAELPVCRTRSRG